MLYLEAAEQELAKLPGGERPSRNAVEKLQALGPKSDRRGFEQACQQAQLRIGAHQQVQDKNAKDNIAIRWLDVPASGVGSCAGGPGELALYGFESTGEIGKRAGVPVG